MKAYWIALYKRIDSQENIKKLWGKSHQNNKKLWRKALSKRWKI